jgi:hypothetical protein
MYFIKKLVSANNNFYWGVFHKDGSDRTFLQRSYVTYQSARSMFLLYKDLQLGPTFTPYYLVEGNHVFGMTIL